MREERTGRARAFRALPPPGWPSVRALALRRCMRGQHRLALTQTLTLFLALP